MTIHGFVDVPYGESPYLVVIALHEYINPQEYQTLDYSARYADAAQYNHFVLHPNLRNFPPSDEAEQRRDFHTGYTIDVLNLLAYLREMAGKEGGIHLRTFPAWVFGGTASTAVSPCES